MSSPVSRIYLASQSPRRRELLQQIGVSYEPLLVRSNPARALDVDETPIPNELPADYVQRVCRDKAVASYAVMLARGIKQMPILTADTTVALDQRILGKPRDEQDAAEMLSALSGREHQVLTAIVVASQERVAARLVVSKVQFAKLSTADIQAYLASGEYKDKAGAYAIQGLASVFVAHLTGSYSGVMGLPLYETAQLLKEFNYPVPKLP